MFGGKKVPKVGVQPISPDGMSTYMDRSELKVAPKRGSAKTSTKRGASKKTSDVYPTARLFAQYEGGSVPPFVLEALSRALGKRVTNATATNDVRAFIRSNRPNVRELPYEVPSDLLSNRASARELLLNTQ